jgi:hypothetical protein
MGHGISKGVPSHLCGKNKDAARVRTGAVSHAHFDRNGKLVNT